MGIDLAAVVAAVTALRQAILDHAGPEPILRRSERFLATLAPERAKVGGKFRDLENADTLLPEQRRLLREAGQCVSAFGFAYDLLGQRGEVLDLLEQVEALGQRDGPDPDQLLFRWNGQSTTLQPIPWRLLRVMWSRDSVEVENEDLADVWGHVPSDDALAHAMKAVNRALVECGYSRTLGIKNGRLRWRD
jgi:hypothetical protein